MKFNIKANTNNPINIAETIPPATNESKNVNAKNELTNVTNPPKVKHLPYSHTHSFVSFFIPKDAVTYNRIKVIAANIIPITNGTDIMPTAITPAKNNAPITNNFNI